MSRGPDRGEVRSAGATEATHTTSSAGGGLGGVPDGAPTPEPVPGSPPVALGEGRVVEGGGGDSSPFNRPSIGFVVGGATGSGAGPVCAVAGNCWPPVAATTAEISIANTAIFRGVGFMTAKWRTLRVHTQGAQRR